MSGQLRLFPPARPLQERFGAEFFRAIPKCPGVYFMHDGRGKIIYVGKAKNLRQRLGSYRYLRAERASRKSIRLIHTVEKIEWELCDSDLAAQLRENFLLRTHRPRFNTVNVFPQAYCFIGSRASVDGWELCFTREKRDDHRLFGSFKPGARYAFHALLRSLWSLVYKKFSLTEFPNGLLGATAPKRFVFSTAAASDWMETAHQFLAGENSDLLTRLDQQRALWPSLSSFENQLLDTDHETLSDFFTRVTSRHRVLQQKFGLAGNLIPQELLNDLLVQERFAANAAAPMQ